MQFSKSALAVIALVAGPFVANAFTAPGASFVSTRVATNTVSTVSTHGTGCPCGPCASTHAAGCSCLSCGMKTVLRMSEDAEAEAPAAEAEVPAEVKAVDGVESEEEAHNADRPQRDSGTKKHKTKAKSGTPLADLEIGSFVDGTVKTITSYGAFVDIGAATDALLHVSRLSDSFVSSVEDIVKAGDSVNVRVVSVDAEKSQIAISMLSEEAEQNALSARKSSGGRRKDRPQRSQGDKGAQIATLNALAEKGFATDKFVEGEVVSTLAFGAFVRFSVSELAEGVEGELDGLVHISALAAQRTNDVTDVCNVGDKVQIRVREIDTDGNKVSLSMISVEDEAASRPQRKKGGGRGRAMFSPEEMGAKDWKEQLEKFSTDKPAFVNMPVVTDRRKETTSA